MALYRNIHLSFWTDTKVNENFTPEDKCFMLYCLTNPHTNIIGCYEISIKQISDELGYSKECIENLLNRFGKFHKMIEYEKETKELFIKNWSKYNWSSSCKLDKPILSAIKEVKCERFKKFLVGLYNARDTVSIPYSYGIDTTITITDTITNNKEKKFVKPTLEEVQAYAQQRGREDLAQIFFEYFNAGEWHDGNGTRVKNWKQKFITWETRNPKQERAADQPKRKIKFIGE